MQGTKRGLLERLDAGEVIIGDGAYIKTLEQRCYVLPVHWTPEVVCEYPEAVLQLGTEFCRAGADITQVALLSQNLRFFSDRSQKILGQNRDKNIVGSFKSSVQTVSLLPS